MNRSKRLAEFEAMIGKRILVSDGAFGTELQTRKLVEEDYRSDIFTDHNMPLKGNHDILNLTRPDIIKDVHAKFFAAGADFASTNTFSSTVIGQADYGLEDRAADIAQAGARLAREAADEWSEKTGSLKGVLGSIGPTNKTLSISPDVNDPGFRDMYFDQVYNAYYEQALAMQDYIDFYLIETIFDTLNAKAAIKAVNTASQKKIPIILSGTITDASGRTLSGQTGKAFWISVRHAKPWAVGLNCALGAEQLRPRIAEIAAIADTRIMVYPNAGLPNAFGEYDETPHTMSNHIGEWALSGLVNIVGGCCGTTPEHLQAIARAVKDHPPRSIPDYQPTLRLSGLEPFPAI